MIWFSYEFFYKRPLILCLGLMGGPFRQDGVFHLNLACVIFDYDEFLAYDSFRQPWFVHDDRFDPISLMVYLTKSS